MAKLLGGIYWTLIVALPLYAALLAFGCWSDASGVALEIPLYICATAFAVGCAVTLAIHVLRERISVRWPALSHAAMTLPLLFLAVFKQSLSETPEDGPLYLVFYLPVPIASLLIHFIGRALLPRQREWTIIAAALLAPAVLIPTVFYMTSGTTEVMALDQYGNPGVILRVMENSFYWRPPIILISIVTSSALTMWVEVTTPNPR